MLSGVRVLCLHRGRFSILTQGQHVSESTAPVWTPSATELVSVEALGQILTAQVDDHTDDFERFVVMKLLVETLAGLSVGSTTKLTPIHSHKHAVLDLPDVERDGLVSCARLL